MTRSVGGVFRRIATRVRHAKALHALEPAWRLLHTPYRAVLGVLSRGRGVEVTVGGESMRLGLAYAGVSWETVERASYAAYRAACAPGGVIVDVGAHVGTYTVIGARAVGATGLVLAFEPVPGTRAALERHLAWNLSSHGNAARVVVRPVALGATAGEVTLYLTADEGDAEASPVERTGARPITVPRSTVDVELAAIGRHVTLLKIDVEGQELAVLAGASRTLATDRPVVLVSAHPAALAAAAGAGEDDVVRALAAHGYAVRVLARDHEVHLLATPPVR